MYRRLYITSSRIFEKQGRTKIGRQLLISAASSILNIGDTIAIFIRSGNIPLCSDKSNKYLRGPQSSPKKCSITLKFISSAPGLLFVFKEKRHLSIRLFIETDWAG